MTTNSIKKDLIQLLTLEFSVKWDRCGVPMFANAEQTNIGGHTDKHCPEMMAAIRKHLCPIMDKHLRAMSDELKEVVGPPYNLDAFYCNDKEETA